MGVSGKNQCQERILFLKKINDKFYKVKEGEAFFHV